MRSPKKRQKHKFVRVWDLSRFLLQGKRQVQTLLKTLVAIACLLTPLFRLLIAQNKAQITRQNVLFGHDTSNELVGYGAHALDTAEP